MASSSWLLLMELLERGDPSFVDELRRCDDADRLAKFAPTWFADRRPAARRFLLEYLRLPLNAFRHEPLVKRLFKAAEKAGDDEVMAHFLVLFDRSVRREKRQRYRWKHEQVRSQAAAEALVQQWRAEGASSSYYNSWSGTHHVSGGWPEEQIYVPRGTAMPREQEQSDRSRTFTGIQYHRHPEYPQYLSEKQRKKLERRRLFSVHTRNYLRRRTWRYFRELGEKQPDRYVAAVVQALQLYTDADMSDGLALLDNWGLIHILFHHCPALWSRPHGWTLAPGRGLNELTPAPIFTTLWNQASQVFLTLLKSARCRPVRQWVLHYLRADPSILGKATLEDLFALVLHDDPEVAALGAEALRAHAQVGHVRIERWLEVLGRASPAALDVLCALLEAKVRPDTLSLDQLVDLACSRPVPVARLGLAWLKTRTPGTTAELQAIFRLAEAHAGPVRPELVRWARDILGRAAEFKPAWLLEFLDSRHADVRREGWTWLLEEPRARDDIELWQRLLESPYDDVRLKLVNQLESRYAGKTPALTDGQKLNVDLLRLLWASVLLNIHRGNRFKPVVVQQVVRRLNRQPGDADALLPLLKVALRSVRGPEWRAGLAGIVQLVERSPAMKPLVEKNFPELQWTG